MKPLIYSIIFAGLILLGVCMQLTADYYYQIAHHVHDHATIDWHDGTRWEITDNNVRVMD
jgi:hypothetical protein